MALGGQTITVVNFTFDGDTRDALGVKTELSTETTVTGVHFRPLTKTEAVLAQFDMTTEIWQCTAEPHPAIMAMNAMSYIKYQDNIFDVVAGPQPHTDFSSAVFKVTVLAQKQEAGSGNP